MRMATGDRHTPEQVVHKLAQADRAVQECLVTALLWVDAPPDDPVAPGHCVTVGESDSIAVVTGAILGALQV
jgi:ADP-ribosylglycohydrolase